MDKIINFEEIKENVENALKLTRDLLPELVEINYEYFELLMKKGFKREEALDIMKTFNINMKS